MRIEPKEEYIEHEIFEDIPWYKWKYQVSNLGRVRSINYNMTSNVSILVQHDNWWWYLQVWLSNNWKRKTFKVHRLVMLTFKWESRLDVNHRNWVKTDNRLDNLEYCTRKKNIKHAFEVLWHKNNFQINHPKNNKWLFWWNNHCAKKVKQFSKKWEFIKVWDSIVDVKRELNIYINGCLSWKRKTAWGFIWKYI